MNTSKTIAIFLCVFLLQGWAHAQPTAFFQIIVDKTGSMIVTRPSTGNTRYQDAITRAEIRLQEAVQEGIANNGDLFVSVATFNANTGFLQLVDFGTASEAATALNKLRSESPNFLTPLADALCTGADELFAESAPGNYRRTIAFFTDLDENASTGPCSGVDWQQNVILKFFSGFPSPVFNVTTFLPDDSLTQFLPFDPLAKATPNDEMLALSKIYESAGAIPPKTLSTTQEEVTFMQFLASSTGGRFVGYGDNQINPIVDTGGASCGVYFPCTR